MASPHDWLGRAGRRAHLAGKVVLLSGSARGIGLAIAEQCAERGARVVLSDVLEDELARAAEQLAAGGHEVLAQRCDVSAADQCAELVRSTVARFGALDAVVNNAGISIVAPFSECTPEASRKLVEVNLLGSVFLSLAALAELERARGHLIFIASVSGIRAIPTGALYSASKAAMRSLAESLRVELAPKGIHVGVVSPGFTTSEASKTVMRGDGTPRPIDRPPHDTPEGVARQVVRLIERRERERVLTPLGKLTALLQRCSPTLLDHILARRELRS